MRLFPAPVVLAAVCLALPACELKEVTIAEPEAFVVVEALLFGGAREFTVALHGAMGSEALIEPDASITLAGPDGRSTLFRTFPGDCLAPDYHLDADAYPGGFACYVVGWMPPEGSADPPPGVRPGALYRLDVELPDGSRLTGATRVPQQVAFTIAVGEDPSVCYLEPGTQGVLSWRPVPGAAAYIVDLVALGVRDALAREGIEADVPEPLRLRGLAIGSADTSIVLPREFGIFDRFTLDPDLLIALQRGVPEGVTLQVLLAAVDQNYVNWVRGGDFNPSGLIRTPSMHGTGGTGVFGSLTRDVFNAQTHAESEDAPPCDLPPPE